jgi:hypothetical protein
MRGEQQALEFTATEAKRRGMRQAIDHATQLDPTWRARALEYTRQFALQNAYLRCEEVRALAESDGFAPPPDKRSWGQIMVDAKVARLITKLGFVTATDPKVHCNPVGYWKSLIYRGKA